MTGPVKYILCRGVFNTDISMKYMNQLIIYRVVLSIFSLFLFAGFGSNTACAQGHERQVVQPEITNPAIRKIMDDRSSRLNEIIDLKSKEYIGETDHGLLEIIHIRPIPLAEEFALETLVERENMARQRMYLLVARAQGAGETGLAGIKERYARALHEEAVTGEWIQSNDKLWYKKE